MLQRTPEIGALRYDPDMLLKTFSYLMIGVFASGLVMTLLGAASVISGL